MHLRSAGVLAIRCSRLDSASSDAAADHECACPVFSAGPPRAGAPPAARQPPAGAAVPEESCLSLIALRLGRRSPYPISPGGQRPVWRAGCPGGAIGPVDGARANPRPASRTPGGPAMDGGCNDRGSPSPRDASGGARFEREPGLPSLGRNIPGGRRRGATLRGGRAGPGRAGTGGPQSMISEKGYVVSGVELFPQGPRGAQRRRGVGTEAVTGVAIR